MQNTTYISRIIVDKGIPMQHKDFLSKIGYTMENGLRQLSRMSQASGIQKRYHTLNQEGFIAHQYLEDQWAIRLLKEIDLDRSKIGQFIFATNNFTSSQIFPNSSALLAKNLELNDLDELPVQLNAYACGVGIIALKKAQEYCKLNNKHSLIVVQDNCTASIEIVNKNNKNWKDNARSNIIFNDGIAVILVSPECLLYEVGSNVKKLRIEKVNNKYTYGDVIQTEKYDNRFIFLTRSNVKDTIPKLVSEQLIQPFMAAMNRSSSDYKYIATHQGGLPIVAKLKELNNFSDTQLKSTISSFITNGNMSAPSVFFALSYLLDHEEVKKEEKILLLGFGAGYYYGACSLSYEI